VVDDVNDVRIARKHLVEGALLDPLAEAAEVERPAVEHGGVADHRVGAVVRVRVADVVDLEVEGAVQIRVDIANELPNF
jgi:hypothetical protein